MGLIVFEDHVVVHVLRVASCAQRYAVILLCLLMQQLVLIQSFPYLGYSLNLKLVSKI